MLLLQVTPIDLDTLDIGEADVPAHTAPCCTFTRCGSHLVPVFISLPLFSIWTQFLSYLCGILGNLIKPFAVGLNDQWN